MHLKKNVWFAEEGLENNQRKQIFFSNQAMCPDLNLDDGCHE